MRHPDYIRRSAPQGRIGLRPVPMMGPQWQLKMFHRAKGNIAYRNTVRRTKPKSWSWPFYGRVYGRLWKAKYDK